MGDYTYTREKLYVAIRSLAIGKGDVRERLNNAFLTFHTLTEKDFPPEFQKDWSWVSEQLTKHGPMMGLKGEVWRGSVENTMSRIKNNTGAKIAEKIFEIGWAMHTNEKYF